MDTYGKLVKKPMGTKILQKFDKAWTETVAIFPDLMHAQREAKKKGESTNAIPFDRDHFNRMLGMPSLQQLFEVAKRMGPPGTEEAKIVWTTSAEELYYQDILIKYIQGIRREEYIKKIAADFRDESEGRKNKFYLAEWAKYCVRRRRARYLFAESIVRYHVDSLGDAWKTWTDMAIKKSQLAVIQVRCNIQYHT